MSRPPMLPFLLAALCSLPQSYGIKTSPPASACRFLPGDPGWPTPADWDSLNRTVGGRLIATVPIASVCHYGLPYSNYDETACRELVRDWTLPQTLESHPAELLNPFFQNKSCDPFSSPEQPCDLGNYVSYSINVTGADDVRAGIRFAQQKGIRLVIKTTGHDFTGRSTGKGAVALWMWNLKSVQVLEQYAGSGYYGPALKVGAGTVAGEAYLEAHKSGYTLVGGECPSVSVAGGYSQGGGHSILGTAYGMGADQVLEWEVVTASGDYVVATPSGDHADLYWALAGGGGGTYGAVLSATVRAFPDLPIAGGTLIFANTENAAYWEAVDLWIQQASRLIGQNNTVFWVVQENVFATAVITLPGQPESAVSDLLAPFLAHLARLNITYTFSTRYSSSFLEHFNTSSLGPLPYGPPGGSTTLNNRIVPTSIIESAASRAQLVDAFRRTVAGGDFLVGCGFMSANNNNIATNTPDNAVLPAWRESIMGCNVNAIWDFRAPLAKNHRIKSRLVNEVVPLIERVSPGGGVYLNEMDPWYKGDWKRELYGANYARLLEIKHRYDSGNLFWGAFSVASDEMHVDGKGRLCRVRHGK